MDGGSLSSLSEEETSTKQHLAPKETHGQKTSLHSGQVEDLPHGERLLSGEEQLTLITESMSVTSADEEKLQLLNKNTELRRLNKELMKLNEDWDHIYRSTTASLQQRVVTLERECTALKQLNSRLLLKVEHEQNKSEYYEQTLMQELKKNQRFQDYICHLESRLHSIDPLKPWALGTEDVPSEARALERNNKVASSGSSELHQRSRSIQGTSEKQTEAIKEVQDLKEQLEALRCQTKIYEADYKVEHKDHERMVQENKKLRRREGEMRQQMALLQEQLKVYEDDFHKERSDKQILQRLLLKKTPAVKEPVLIHRCNNEQEQEPGERRRNRQERAGAYRCPKHCENHRELDYP